jgi:hypothetical protein
LATRNEDVGGQRVMFRAHLMHGDFHFVESRL